MDQTPPTIASAGANPVATTAIAATPPIGASATAVQRRRAFHFGEPEGVLDRRDLLRNAEARFNGRWYEPPIKMEALARSRHMSPHHSSALKYKVNQLVRHFEPSRWLDRKNFGAFALNFLAMGNAYLERRNNLAGRAMTLVNAPAINTRRGRDDEYIWIDGYRQATTFLPGTVFHLWEEDLAQEIYGLPEWLSALQSGLLNEAATVFRRRYFANGSHAGYILYVSEEKFADADADDLDAAIAESKGPGNFRNIFLHIPGGDKDGVKVIPVGEAAAKDEFMGVKGTTRDDVLAAHRVPPVLLGVVPQNTGGFGDVAKAADVFHQAEIDPLMMRMLELNDWLGLEAVRFRPYERQSGTSDKV